MSRNCGNDIKKKKQKKDENIELKNKIQRQRRIEKTDEHRNLQKTRNRPVIHTDKIE